jgi:hypothetical protein
MLDAVDAILADLQIAVIPTNQTRGPMQTKARQILRAIFRDHGEGHLILLLRTITESNGNELALIAPCLLAVSDVMRAHPAWPNRGLQWIEAFDNIDLVAMQKTASANRKASPQRGAIATMLYERLAPAFVPPKRVRPPRKPSPRTISKQSACSNWRLLTIFRRPKTILGLITPTAAGASPRMILRRSGYTG